MVRLASSLVAVAAVAASLAPAYAHDGLKNLKHIVLFMQENRAFDHYFGTMEGVRGFQDPNVIISKNTGKSVFHQPVNESIDPAPPKHVKELLPWHLNYMGGDWPERTQCMVAGTNDWRENHQAWNNGEMDHWALANTPFSVGYYRREDIPTQFALAGNFTTADMYYESIISSTDPNRVSFFSGTINVNTSVVGGDSLNKGGPVIDNSNNPWCLKADNNDLFSCRPLRWKTVPEYLMEKNITFQFYQDFDNFDDDTLVQFEQYRKAAKNKEELAARAVGFPGLKKFYEDAKKGTLPEGSYIVAPMQLSEHPPYTPRDGAWIQRKVAQAVMTGKNWDSTALLVSYDETGGWADHVVGPIPPKGTPGEYLIDPYNKSLGEVPIGPGFRLPFYTISPFTRNGGVFTEHAAHESQIFFLEEWAKAHGKGFHVKEVNPWRRKHLSNLVNMFDFSSKDTSTLELAEVKNGGQKDPITNLYSGATLCGYRFRNDVQPKVPYGQQNETDALRVERGYKPVRGHLTEGRYLVFEANNKALSHSDGSKLGAEDAQKYHNGKNLKFIIHSKGSPSDYRFNIKTFGNVKKFVSESLDLTSNKDDAAVFEIKDAGNGKGHKITNVKSRKELNLGSDGTVSMKEHGATTFKVFSVTF